MKSKIVTMFVSCQTWQNITLKFIEKKFLNKPGSFNKLPQNESSHAIVWNSADCKNYLSDISAIKSAYVST